MTRAPRSRAIAALLLSLAVASAPGASFAQPAPTAAAEIALGDKAAKAKSWDEALAHYQAAFKATPTARALLGIANAQYQLGKLGEAYESYDEATKAYASGIGPTDKTTVTARMKELAQKTGWLSIRVNESGADVVVDGASMGQSPVRALVRVAVGTHRVHVTKDGFGGFDSNAEVVADGKAVVEVGLTRAATKGHLVVGGGGAEGLRVLVDGVDVGAAPWEGDVAPGSHEVAGRSSTSVAPAQKVDVVAGARLQVDLVAVVAAAHLQVRTSDGKGIVYVDGVVKGEGAFAGDFTPGKHTVVVSREGYERYEKDVDLRERETWAETVTLKPVAAAGSSGESAERPFEGIYGGFGLAGFLGVGGQGTDLETNCSALSASKCNTPMAQGVGAFGYLGYELNPVGFELLLAASADENKQDATFDGTKLNGGLPLAQPSRVETFTYGRFGGLAALRFRATAQGRVLRGTIAGGVGFSYKSLVMKRETLASDGSTDKYVTDTGAVAYMSPAVTAEAALQIRFSQTTALAIGGFMWAENASMWGTNTAPGPSQQTYLSNGQPIETPAYHLASGPQVLLGPFLGMQFGP